MYALKEQIKLVFNDDNNIAINLTQNVLAENGIAHNKAVAPTDTEKDLNEIETEEYLALDGDSRMPGLFLMGNKTSPSIGGKNKPPTISTESGTTVKPK